MAGIINKMVKPSHDTAPSSSTPSFTPNLSQATEPTYTAFSRLTTQELAQRIRVRKNNLPNIQCPVVVQVQVALYFWSYLMSVVPISAASGKEWWCKLPVAGNGLSSGQLASRGGLETWQFKQLSQLPFKREFNHVNIRLHLKNWMRINNAIN